MTKKNGNGHGGHNELTEKMRTKILTAYGAMDLLDLPNNLTPEDLRAAIRFHASPRRESMMKHNWNIKAENVVNVETVMNYPVSNFCLAYSSENRPRLSGKPYSDVSLKRMFANGFSRIDIEPFIVERLTGDKVGKGGIMDGNTSFVLSTLAGIAEVPVILVDILNDKTREDILWTLNYMLNGTHPPARELRLRAYLRCIKEDIRDRDVIKAVAKEIGVEGVSALIQRVNAHYVREMLRDQVTFDIGDDDSESEVTEADVAYYGEGLRNGTLVRIGKLVDIGVMTRLANMAYNYNMTISDIDRVVGIVQRGCSNLINKKTAFKILDVEEQQLAGRPAPRPTGSPTPTRATSATRTQPADKHSLHRLIRDAANSLNKRLSELINTPRFDGDIRKAASNFDQAASVVESLRLVVEQAGNVVDDFDAQFAKPVSKKPVKKKKKE